MIEPKTLRRVLIAYTILLVGSLAFVLLAHANHWNVSKPGGSWGRLIYIGMNILFLKDLIYRRTLSPAQQFRWVAGFMIFNVFAFWRYLFVFAEKPAAAPVSPDTVPDNS